MWGKIDTGGLHNAYYSCCVACCTLRPEHDPAAGHNNAIDMTLGLPSRTLHRMGIKSGIDEAYVLTMHVGGTAQTPELDYVQYALPAAAPHAMSSHSSTARAAAYCAAAN